MILMLKIISILLTYFAFKGSKMLAKKVNFFLLSPLIISPIVIILVLALTHATYSEYYNGAKGLSFLLGPATVAFAVPMYKNFELLKKHFLEVIASVTVGSAVAIISTLLYAIWLNLGVTFTESLVPRSITTPIAMDVSKTIGGVPTLTAVFVIITGITGAVLGPVLIRILGIKKPTARGLMFGMSAHGAGASKAFEFGELEGTFASLAMIVAALITIILVFTVFPALRTELLF